MTVLAQVSPPELRSALAVGVKRVVLKVGSAVIAADGALRPEVMDRIAAQVAAVRRTGCEVLMVVSGAVAGGYRAMGLAKVPRAVVQRQAAACIGQYRLMTALANAFERHGLAVAQLLMMEGDIENRRRFLSARQTLRLLMARGVVPIINENDALADDEETVGDNDHLAALVTNVASADLLIILSSVEGLYRNGQAGEVIAQVESDGSCEDHIVSTRSATGVGGMRAKMSAARLAARFGVPTVIAGGDVPDVIPRVLAGEPVGTLVTPKDRPLNSRRRWVAFRARSRGSIRVDSGARTAICTTGANLLPAGVVDVCGQFAKGARVDVQDEHGDVFAVGLVCYSANEIRLMRGRGRGDFSQVLGYEYVPEIIDSRDLALIGDGEV